MDMVKRNLDQLADGLVNKQEMCRGICEASTCLYSKANQLGSQCP